MRDRHAHGALSLFLIEEQTVRAIEIETMLEDLGHRVEGVAASLGQALDRLEGAEDRIDGVLMTPSVLGHSARPVVRELRRMGIPYVLLTDLPEPETRRLGFRAPHLGATAPPSAVARALRDLSAIAPRRSASAHA